MKKRTSPLKRENWKGKYRFVQRDNRGRIVSHFKYTAKIKKDVLLGRIKRTGSIRKNVKIEGLGSRIPGKNFAEVVISGRKAAKPKRNYQYYVILRIKRKKVEARSQSHPSNYSKKRARQKALENAVLRGTQVGEEYDDDTAALVLEDKKYIIIDEGIVYYRLI